MSGLFRRAYRGQSEKADVRAADASSVTLEFPLVRAKTGHMAIPVVGDVKPPLLLIVDTGCAPAMILEESAAQSRGIKVTQSVSQELREDQARQIVGFAENVVLPLRLRDGTSFSAMVDSLMVCRDTGTFSLLKQNGLGVMGLGFLRRWHLFVSEADRMIRLENRQGSYSTPDATIPFVTRNGRVRVRILAPELCEKPIEAVLDTGTNRSQIPAEALRIELSGAMARWKTDVKLLGWQTVKFRRSPKNWVSFADAPDIRQNLSLDIQEIAPTDYSSDRAALAGRDLLAGYDYRLDFVKNRLCLYRR